MFFQEEDIQPVVDAVTQTLGPQGSIIVGKNVSKNVIVGSPQFGKLWYGDIEGDVEYVQSLCHLLSQRTGHRISIVSDTF